MQDLSPIILFVYNRPEHTRKVLEALAKNNLAQESTLYIIADGPKKDLSSIDLERIREVRKIIRSKPWCGKVIIKENESNQGIESTVVTTLNEHFRTNSKVIVLEDDIITSENFLMFMNESLNFYQKEEKVMHISGYTLPLRSRLPETFFYQTAFCWGWATWKRAWDQFINDPQVLYSSIAESGRFPEFSLQGLNYEGDILKKSAEAAVSKTNSEFILSGLNPWDVCWSATIFLKRGLALHPGLSMVRNIGFDGTGTHFNKTRKSPFEVNFDPHREIRISNLDLEYSSAGIKATKDFFFRLRNPTIKSRVKTRLKQVIKSIIR